MTDRGVAGGLRTVNLPTCCRHWGVNWAPMPRCVPVALSPAAVSLLLSTLSRFPVQWQRLLSTTASSRRLTSPTAPTKRRLRLCRSVAVGQRLLIISTNGCLADLLRRIAVGQPTPLTCIRLSVTLTFGGKLPGRPPTITRARRPYPLAWRHRTCSRPLSAHRSAQLAPTATVRPHTMSGWLTASQSCTERPTADRGNAWTNPDIRHSLASTRANRRNCYNPATVQTNQ